MLRPRTLIGATFSAITGRSRAASAQGEWENLPSRHGALSIVEDREQILAELDDLVPGFPGEFQHGEASVLFASLVECLLRSQGFCSQFLWIGEYMQVLGGEHLGEDSARRVLHHGVVFLTSEDDADRVSPVRQRQPFLGEIEIEVHLDRVRVVERAGLREANSPDGVWRIGAVAITEVDSPDSVGRISGLAACLDPELRTRASSAPDAAV